VHCNRYKGIKDLSELVVDPGENASVLNRGFKLHDSGLRYFCAAWHGLAPEVRDAIVRIARGQGDFSRVGE
jgi:hypothetical protein